MISLQEIPESCVGSSVSGSEVAGDKSSILDEIDKQMSDLQHEMDRYSLQESLSGADNEETTTGSDAVTDSITDIAVTPPPGVGGSREQSYSPPPLPPPEHQPMPNLQKPSLPEPEGPPPPPPTQNGYAFTNVHFNPEAQKAMNTLKRNKGNNKSKEPIYESIKPRPEPVGGSGNSPPASEYRSFNPVPTSVAPPVPPPAAPPPQDADQDSQYGFGNLKPEENIYQSRALAARTPGPVSGSPSPSPSNMTRLAPQGVSGPPPPGPIQNIPETEREQRRLLRVRRELEKIQEVNEEEAVRKEQERHDLIEFAENYFNDHEKSPSGTIVGTIKRSKTMEVLPKSEMLKFYKGSSIPNSHIHMFDPENVNLALNIFKDLVKYAKGELKGDSEIATIQQIIQLGIDREELRDEIYVQVVRQLNDNPHQEQIERLWLLLCLVVVAFPTGKAFYKYFVSFLQSSLGGPGRSLQYIQWCMDNSHRAQAAPRKLPPSSVEIAAMKRLGTIVCRFFFLDGRTKAIDVHPCDTAQDSVSKLADKIGLQSTEGWALFESGPNRESHIPGNRGPIQTG